jgi:hypothetical protein
VSIIYLGTVSAEPDETISFQIPPDASPDAIAAALEAAETERLAARAAETKRLREIFLDGDKRADE